MIKRPMGRIPASLAPEGLKARMLLQVHDELLLAVRGTGSRGRGYRAPRQGDRQRRKSADAVVRENSPPS
jgi:hypothetical protein